MAVYACVRVHGHVPGFTAPGSPRVCGGLAAPSPTLGSLRRPDRSAIVPSGTALQDPSRLVSDTHTQPNPPSPGSRGLQRPPPSAGAPSRLRDPSAARSSLPLCRQPLQVPLCATVLETHGRWCTVRDMTQKVRAEPLDTGPGLQVWRLGTLAGGHRTHRSPSALGGGGGLEKGGSSVRAPDVALGESPSPKAPQPTAPQNPPSEAHQRPSVHRQCPSAGAPSRLRDPSSNDPPPTPPGAIFRPPGAGTRGGGGLGALGVIRILSGSCTALVDLGANGLLDGAGTLANCNARASGGGPSAPAEACTPGAAPAPPERGAPCGTAALLRKGLTRGTVERADGAGGDPSP